jgi:hypothetical protein
MGVEFNAEIIDMRPEKLFIDMHPYFLAKFVQGMVRQRLEPNVSTQQPSSSVLQPSESTPQSIQSTTN